MPSSCRVSQPNEYDDGRRHIECPARQAAGNWSHQKNCPRSGPNGRRTDRYREGLRHRYRADHRHHRSPRDVDPDRAAANRISAPADIVRAGGKQCRPRQRPDLCDRDGVAWHLHVHRSQEGEAIRRRTAQAQRRTRGRAGALEGRSSPTTRNSSRPSKSELPSSSTSARNWCGLRSTSVRRPARELGDNDANRTLRTQLNVDLEALARIYNERAREAVELGDKGRYASWYLLLLGFGAMIFAALNVYVMKNSVVGPISEITQATDRIAAGNLDSEIPYFSRTDEIGRLALAVQNFRNAVNRNRRTGANWSAAPPSNATRPWTSATSSTTSTWRRNGNCPRRSTACRKASSCWMPR